MNGGDGFRLGYRPPLDGLRGLSVLAVLGHHASLPYFTGGFIGVAVFFTLSGFLITVLLCDEFAQHDTIRLRSFYLRRILRLFPAFALLALVLGGYAIATLEAAPRTRVFEQIAAAMFYVTNWLIALEWWPKFALLAHTWSLSLEEQFYSLWPAALLLGLRRAPNGSTLVIGVCATFVASAVWRAVLFANHDSYVRAYYGSFSNADMLLAGCVVGLIATRGQLTTNPIVIRGAAWTAAGLLVATSMFGEVDAPILYFGGFAAIAIASALLIVGVLVEPQGWLARLLSLRPLVAIGKISYGLYLWHFPVYIVTRYELAGQAPNTVTAVGIGATFALATCSYVIVERYFLRLKERTRAGGAKSTSATR